MLYIFKLTFVDRTFMLKSLKSLKERETAVEIVVFKWFNVFLFKYAVLLFAAGLCKGFQESEGYQ